MRYVISFACDDREPMQRTLNELYAYGDDLPTKVLHRCRPGRSWPFKDFTQFFYAVVQRS